ncbi:U-box domain-containing protein 4 [Lactuca sativa]|uniref:U-box domain-containing protein 4 n=1 Tax=Lactuca sativa TaxID=4236 RepID=UPI0022AFE7CB|nr:U-box domain-containing protein 4 [Lactuca sativa]XP_052626605.1 U-box domain-containing protein 4 [Lactuca sativa]XP_052626606.1 U-box domain-containing protein 4 [Lactuca sativa]XP_052626607.1 U-box domain-containing protein 4 [Lactuca sativa]
MEISLLKVLLKNISTFFHLPSHENRNSEIVGKYYQKIEEILKLNKPVLESITDSEISSNESLQKEFAGLNQSIDELRELLEDCHPLMSKVYFVMQIESLFAKIRSQSLQLFELLQSSNDLPDELSSSSLEHCIQKIKHMGHEKSSSILSKAIRDQTDGSGPSVDSRSKIADFLNLKSNQELLIEAVALEKLKENAEQAEKIGDLEVIEEMINLVTHMIDCLIESKQSESSNPVPIPPDFCCPLSLELMTDPVIVASGQTYERGYIRKWLDLGLTVCPKTMQTLAHTNLIPNYTVKALIANWCESNNVKLPDRLTPVGVISSFHEPNSPVHHHHVQTPSVDSLPENTPESGDQGENSTVSNTNESQADEVVVPPEVAVEVAAQPAATATPRREHEYSPRFEPRPRNQLWRRPSDRFGPRIVSSPTTETRPDLTAVETQVKKLVNELTDTSIDVVRNTTGELRLLARHNMDNRIVIANCGAINLLIGLLKSTDEKVQENSVTALLNLSINDNNKTAIANADAIEPLIHVLETGSSEAKENSAATLFSLSVIEDNKIRIGRSGAIRPLVDLLGNGTPRGKKDAATALFNLSIFHENKARIVQAGAVKYLVELMDPAAGMVDKAVAVLSNLATIPEGRTAIGQEGGIPVLVEVVELGSARGKENAAAALLQLCTNSSRFCNMVLQEGAVPPLVALSQSGTPRAKEKAQSLLSYFRNQRHGNGGRG